MRRVKLVVWDDDTYEHESYELESSFIRVLDSLKEFYLTAEHNSTPYTYYVGIHSACKHFLNEILKKRINFSYDPENRMATWSK